MDRIQANRAEQDEVLTLNIFCYDNRQPSGDYLIFYFLERFFLKRIWVPYFSLLDSGGKKKPQKIFTPAVLQFHFRVEQTSHSKVEEYEDERLFTTRGCFRFFHPVGTGW